MLTRAMLLLVAGAAGAVAAAPGQPPVQRSRSEKAEVVNRVLTTRQEVVADSARVEVRALYLYFGRDTGFRRLLAPAIRPAVAGAVDEALGRADDTPYRGRWWRRIHVKRDGPELVELTARVFHGSEHVLRYTLHRSAGVWGVARVELSDLICY